MFHQVPQQDGLIAGIRQREKALAATGGEGGEAAPAPEFLQRAPRISVHLPATAIYDARLADAQARWPMPETIKRPRWRGWHERDVADVVLGVHELGAEPEARLVQRRGPIWNMPLLNPIYPQTRLLAVQAGLRWLCHLRAQQGHFARRGPPRGPAQANDRRLLFPAMVANSYSSLIGGPKGDQETARSSCGLFVSKSFK